MSGPSAAGTSDESWVKGAIGTDFSATVSLGMVIASGMSRLGKRELRDLSAP